MLLVLLLQIMKTYTVRAVFLNVFTLVPALKLFSCLREPLHENYYIPLLISSLYFYCSSRGKHNFFSDYLV